MQNEYKDIHSARGPKQPKTVLIVSPTSLWLRPYLVFQALLISAARATTEEERRICLACCVRTWYCRHARSMVAPDRDLSYRAAFTEIIVPWTPMILPRKPAHGIRKRRAQDESPESWRYVQLFWQ